MAGKILGNLGPGIIIAATGLGAGDLIASAVAGARYGSAVLWAALLGAAIKFTLNEGLARWQLATGTTLVEAWIQRLPRLVSGYFLVYLFLWSFIVAGALISACGLAAHSLFPVLSVAQWGIIHSMAAMALVCVGRYRLLEHLMKVFIALMFTVILVCAVLVTDDWGLLLRSIVTPSVPEGSVKLILGVIGGVGGSVTLLCYGYWIRERQWTGTGDLGKSRIDLVVAYGLTGLFGMAIMIVAAGVQPEVITGKGMVLSVAEHLGEQAGATAKWCFLVGFWGAVFSSMLGVWQGIPYLFADFLSQARHGHPPAEPVVHSLPYRAWLLYLAIPPLLTLLLDKPVWLVILYAVAGAFFMPFLAGLLLYMNNRRDWVGQWKNRWASNLVLIVALLTFCLLLQIEITNRFL